MKNTNKMRTPLGFRLSSKGFVLLVGVSFCIKAMEKRQSIVQSEYKVHSFLFCYIWQCNKIFNIKV